MDSSVESTPTPPADLRSSMVGIGALIGLIFAVVVLFFFTDPGEPEAEAVVEATPTAAVTPTPTGVPITSDAPDPTATETPPPPTPSPTPDIPNLFSALDLGPGRLVVAEDDGVGAYDLATGERQPITTSSVEPTNAPLVVSWRSISFFPPDGQMTGWVSSFWGRDREQSPLPTDFDPGFSVGAPTDGSVYAEVVFGATDGGRQLLATHLATGEDVLIPLASDVRDQVLAGWPPQITSLRDTLYISSGSRLFSWGFSAREWVDVGPGTLVATTGPGVLVTDCSIDVCSVRQIGPEGESIARPEVDASVLPGRPGEAAAFSPDGSALAYATVGSTPTLRGQQILRLIDLDTGVKRELGLDNPDLLASRVIWPPNGGGLIVVVRNPMTETTGLLLVDPESGNQLELPITLNPNSPFAVMVDIDQLRGLPTSPTSPG